jgi:hypothetical protein
MARLGLALLLSLAAFQARAATLTFQDFPRKGESISAFAQQFSKTAAANGCQLSKPFCLADPKSKKNGVTLFKCTASSSNCSPYAKGSCPAGSPVVAELKACKAIPGGNKPLPAPPKGARVNYVCSKGANMAPRDCYNQMLAMLSGHGCKVTGSGCQAPSGAHDTYCAAASSNCFTASDGDCGAGKQISTAGDRVHCKR